MIGLLTMKSVVEGPFHLATIIVADHQLITRVLTINLSGDTMTITVVVRQSTMKTTRMSLESRPTQMNLLVEVVVAMIIACSVKMCVVPLRAVHYRKRLICRRPQGLPMARE
jgi:hypothetical protein